ncbi:MAG: hypothetical protein J6O51_04365 [Bacteroidales bacterium]|nr:hypothetical protein [Bacteroidales bacterium]
MRKSIFVLAAICAAAIVSCTKKELAVDYPTEQSEAKLIPITITANLEGTKADMAGENGTVWTWQSGDKLAVYDGTTKQEFVLDESSAGTSVAKFTGSVTEGFTTLQAVFPYDKAGDSFGTPQVPASQSIYEGTVDASAMIAVASEAEKVSDDEYNFYFTSGVSLLRFTPPAGATKVILHAVAKDETLAGDSPSVTVELGSAADGTKRFWAAVNPTKLSGIHVFTLKSDNKYYHLSTTKEIDLSAAGKAKNLGSLAAGEEVAVIENGTELADYLANSDLDGFICKDIDLSSVSIAKCATFTKTLDGLHHSIGKWTANGQQSLVRSLKGTIKDMTIAQSCNFSISNTYSCFVCDSVQTAGVLSGIINKATASTRTEDLSGLHFGYLCRVCYGRMENCENYGHLNINVSSCNGNMWIGGLCAFFNTGSRDGIVSCFNAGNLAIKVSGTKKHIYLGGITGGTTNAAYANRSNRGTIKGCNNEGSITYTVETNAGSTYSNIGGVAGVIMGHIKDCSNTGAITYSGPFNDTNCTRPAIAGVAGCVFYSAENCENAGPVTITGTFAAAKNLDSGAGVHTNPSYGGVFGQAGGNNQADAAKDKCSISNCMNKKSGTLTVRTSMNNTNATNTFAGGVVGFTCAPVSNCHNYANLSLTTQSAIAYLGGVIGKFFNSAEECTNSGDVSLDLNIISADGNRSTNCYVGGVIGDQNQSNMSLKKLTNSGNVTISKGYLYTSLSYAGGVIGRSNASLTEFSNCDNSGNVSWPVALASRVGGVAGHINAKVIQGCDNTGNVSSMMNYAQSSAGGFAGFITCNGVKMSSCSSKGTVTAGGDKGGAALLVGGIGNTNQTWNNCSVEGTLTTSGNIYAGYLLGWTVNITAGSSHATSAGSDSPLIIKSSSQMNGSVVSEDDIPGKLCGYKANDYTLNWNAQLQ